MNIGTLKTFYKVCRMVMVNSFSNSFHNMGICMIMQNIAMNQFLFQAKASEQEADEKPVIPSKIPVGSFRVEEEKRINRALSRERSTGRIVRERSMSRIPVFSNRSSLVVGLDWNDMKLSVIYSIDQEPDTSPMDGRGRSFQRLQIPNIPSSASNSNIASR